LESESHNFLQIRSIKLEEMKLTSLILRLFTGHRGGKSGKFLLKLSENLFLMQLKVIYNYYLGTGFCPIEIFFRR